VGEAASFRPPRPPPRCVLGSPCTRRAGRSSSSPLSVCRRQTEAELEHQLRNKKAGYGKPFPNSPEGWPSSVIYMWSFFLTRGRLFDIFGVEVRLVGIWRVAIFEQNSISTLNRPLAQLFPIYRLGVCHRDFELRKVGQKGWCYLGIIDFEFSGVDYPCPR
jgi:hypothetical protein